MKILKFIIKPIIVILVFVSAIWLIGFLNQPSAPSSPPVLSPPQTSFTLSPSQGQFKTGQEFEVTIILKTDQEINGADALLTFDSQALEIIEIRPGSVFPLYPRKDINLEKGQVVITGVKTSKDSQPPSDSEMNRKKTHTPIRTLIHIPKVNTACPMTTPIPNQKISRTPSSLIRV